MNQEITNEVQEVINYVLKYESDVPFRVCTECGRELPIHEWFYTKSKSRNKLSFYFNHQCKECESISYNSGDYKFVRSFNRYWYLYKINEIEKLVRLMSDEQIAKYYNKPLTHIEHILYQNLKINSKSRISNLNENEIIQIYKYILLGERTRFPKGFFNNNDYRKILFKYLFNDILKWNIQDILLHFNLFILDNNYLYGLRKQMKFIDIINLINNIYNSSYKIWEFKNSNTSDYFKTKDNVDEAIKWFKEKIKNDKNIHTIYDAYNYGFFDLVNEYKLYHGLVKPIFNNRLYDFYEEIFKEKFDMEYYNENNYPFDINPIPKSLDNNLMVYKLTDKYYLLDDLGKTIINQVINFCEVYNRFPINQDFLIKNGNISYIYIKKYFGKYSNIFSYILPLKDNVNHCWDIRENRINYVKYYCENKCDTILNVINDTEKLKQWVVKFFNRDIIAKEMSWYNDYGLSLYDLMVEAYPQIKEQKIMFDWEWGSFYAKDRERSIFILKELILYRLNNIIIDLASDIPKYLNFTIVNTIYPKFSTMIYKGKFKSYYEWACLAFPEYKDKWTENDFGMIVAKDDIILSSHEENNIYEFIKYDMCLKYIKFIGNERNGKYRYSLKDMSDYKYTCPDFVIEYVDIDNKKVKLDKPIIIEYYGYYKPDNLHHIFVEYIKKMNVKNKFYNFRDDIMFVDLYPNDLKNNCEGVKNKINEILFKLKECA